MLAIDLGDMSSAVYSGVELHERKTEGIAEVCTLLSRQGSVLRGAIVDS